MIPIVPPIAMNWMCLDFLSFRQNDTPGMGRTELLQAAMQCSELISLLRVIDHVILYDTLMDVVLCRLAFKVPQYA